MALLLQALSHPTNSAGFITSATSAVETPVTLPVTTAHQSPSTFTNPATAITTTLFLQPIPTQRQLPDDQLSEASIHGAPVPLIHTSTATVNAALPLAPTLTFSQATYQHPLPHPVPARLRSRILVGEYIDFNTVLPYAMFSMHDSPSYYHQTPQTFRKSIPSTRIIWLSKNDHLG